jgi:hypothetical protein
MNRTDQAIQQLADALRTLRTNDDEIYVKALRALVDLAISEERLAKAQNVEDDLQQVERIFLRSRRRSPSPSVLENRRVGERRSSVT